MFTTRFSFVATSVFAGLLCSGAPSNSVHADIIFHDDFDGSPETSLGGTTPDISLGAVTWAANLDGFTADGRRGVTGGSGNATLAFSPQPAKLYTLDIQLRDVVGTTQWWGFGFTDRGDRNPARSPFNDARFNLGRSWSIVRGDQTNSSGTFIPNSANQNGRDIETDWSTLNDADGTIFDLDVRIVLDTTQSIWSAEHFAKETSDTEFTLVASQPTIANQSTIDAVGFAVSSNQGAIDGRVALFQLAVVSVPEPSFAGCMAFIFSISAIGFRRRHQA
jgi:hypothetical protein